MTRSISSHRKLVAQPHCFAPVSSKQARVLIIGSFPGMRSLEQQQYYAHPRNAFWPLMAELLGFDRDLDYHDRLVVLLRWRIALWDVLHCCSRSGSLDAAIEPDSIIVNDFVGFFRDHPLLKAVFFNGVRAEKEFRRRVIPELGDRHVSLELVRLPSTSPAMASLSFTEKVASWEAIKSYF